MTKTNQRYPPEFKAEAVKLVTEQGLSQEEAAKRLGIPKGTMGNWIVAAKASNASRGSRISISSRTRRGERSTA
jgi:transposase-like protein